MHVGVHRYSRVQLKDWWFKQKAIASSKKNFVVELSLDLFFMIWYGEQPYAILSSNVFRLLLVDWRSENISYQYKYSCWALIARIDRAPVANSG